MKARHSPKLELQLVSKSKYENSKGWSGDLGVRCWNFI